MKNFNIFRLAMLIILTSPSICKYVVLTDLSPTTLSSLWEDQSTNQALNFCTNTAGEKYIGVQSNTNPITWKGTYPINPSAKLYIYLEYSVSGQWNADELEILANGVKVYSNKITFNDPNKACDQKFLFESNTFFVINQYSETLILEINVAALNVGLYIKNIVILQRYQYGLKQPINFINYIPQCPPTLWFSQYLCRCYPQTYVQNKCLSGCQQNFIYDSSLNECFQMNHCSICSGINTILTCDSGYYKLDGQDAKSSSCVNRCPNDKYQDETLKQCTDLQTYLYTYQNLKYPVHHFYFIKSIPDFMHFFNYQKINIQMNSIPPKNQQRGYFFQDGQFYVGSFDTFQTQTTQLSVNVEVSQFQLRFRAIGHFIDFYPTQNNVYINGVLMTASVLQTSQNNLQKIDQDYIVFYDMYWTRPRTDIYARIQNQIMITISQPLQNGVYQGYFYLEDIQIYQFECLPNCAACFTNAYCTPCFHPANKNPDDCSCVDGYIMKNDVCVACPTYCTYCTVAGVCDSCIAETLRINSPSCDQCAIQYYIQTDVDNCQNCQTGCNQCTSATNCSQCLIGYFRNISNLCVTQCPDGYFNDNSNVNDYKCTICDSNCLKCQNQATNCTACNLNFTLISGHCYQCNEGYYLSGTTCQPCISACQKCNSITCSVCKDSFYYKSSTNQCLATCDGNLYANAATKTCDLCDSQCSTCVGGTSNDCLSCNQGLFLNVLNVLIGFCTTNCETGFYKNGSICSKCWKGCSSCIDPTHACLICAPNYYRLAETGLCYDLCPGGYYNNKFGNVCTPCNPACKTCYGGLETNCLSCSDPYGLYQNQCLNDCPDGYGNINNICLACTANCMKCFGTAQNECMTCNTGFYYLKNQCYYKCPKYFTGVRPQYICKCIYDNCVTCTSTQFYYSNICYDTCPNGTYGYNGMCITCDITCETCYGESNTECLSCSRTQSLIYYQNQCLTECTGNTYEDTSLNECKICDISCLSCVGGTSNDCRSCHDSKVLTVAGSCQDACPDGQYLVLTESICYSCHSSCVTCFANTIYSCLSCINYLYLNQCVDSCPDGFKIGPNQTSCEPDTDIAIANCSYQCSACKYTPRFCTTCSSLRFSNTPNCDCLEGYYDNQIDSCMQCDNKCLTCMGNASKCIKCKGDRLAPNCDCPQFYYDDGHSVNCNKCQDNCATCIDSTSCLTCLSNRINPPDCICPEGYYEAHTIYCQECHLRCNTCIESQLFCLSCSGIRINPPVCYCPDGYFSNSDEICQQCDQTCIDCDATGCLSCFGNRAGPQQGKCPCDVLGVSRLIIGSLYCTDCKTGVPYFELNNYFTGFVFSFGGDSRLSNTIKGDNVCDQIFDDVTLAKLGQNPICDLDLNVLFGDNPHIKVGDTLQLKPVFYLVGCKSNFQIILPNTLQIPFYIDKATHKPLIYFSEIPDPNVCTPIKFNFEKKFFNGGQNFEVLSWTMIQPTTPDDTIIDILNANTLNNSELIIFPQKTFSPNVFYRFQVKVKSFANLENTISLQFTTNQKSTILFSQTQDQNQFQRFSQISIPCAIFYFNCIEQIPPPQILYYSIILANNQQQLLAGNISEGIINGFSQNISLDFKPYFFNFSNPYTFLFQTNLTRSDGNQTSNSTFDIYIVPSSPILTIEGGNRMVGYTENIYLNATVNDQDLSSQEAVLVSYQCFWSCTDIVNETSCLGQDQLIVQFDNNCNQIIKSRTFTPYQVFNFQVSILKEEVTYSTKVAIQIIELDLPTLIVIGADQTQTYNYYDEFIYSLQYSGINPDLLMYAGALIYNQTVQATFQFYYLDFKFKLQNYFTNLTQSIGNTLKLRLSVYDPRYIMPSLNTLSLQMNIPPVNCQISIINWRGQITEFSEYLDFSIIGCLDHDLPLYFDIWLFPNITVYETDLARSFFYNYLVVAADQYSNSYSLTLPYLNEEDCLLVVLIRDQQQGRTNLTKSISVQKNLTLDNSTFINYHQSLQSLNQKLFGISIITERLTRTAQFIEYKEQLYREMIEIDKNQTMLANQTQILYYSISILINQNSSLLSLNSTTLFYQLNYRIPLAYQKLFYFNQLQLSNILTSQQNVEKVHFIKQYFTFINILSAFINYNVAHNISSIQIQNELQQMQEHLQQISLANEPLYKVSASAVNLNFGFVTSKIATSLSGSSLSSNHRLLEEESDNNTEYNTSTNFYKYSMTRYIDNPYYANSQFPKNSSGYQAIDPRIQLNTSSSNSNASLNFQFPVTKKLETNTSLKCITQVDSGEWNANICSSVNQTGQIICKCDSLNPTSIMESLDYILDKASQVFSLDTLLAFGSFPFYKTIVFYFYVFITGIYFSVVYWGVKADNIMFTKIHLENELAEQKQKELDELKEQQEKKEIDNATSIDGDYEFRKKELLTQNQPKTVFKNNQSFQKVVSSAKFSLINTPVSEQGAELKSEDQTNRKERQKASLLFKHSTPHPPSNEQLNHEITEEKSEHVIQLQKGDEPLRHQQSFKENQQDKEKDSSQKKPQGLKEMMMKKSISKFRAFVEYLKFFHQLLSIIYKSDQKKPRGLRASIVYTSILGSLAVLFVFNQPNNLSFTVALALLTAPINKIYQILLEKLLSHKKKIVRTFGAIFMIISAGVISYVMLSGLVMMDSVETANQWSYIFVGQFFGDNIFYSPIQLIFQYLVHMELIRTPLFQALLAKILDEKAKEFLYGLIDDLNEES